MEVTQGLFGGLVGIGSRVIRGMGYWNSIESYYCSCRHLTTKEGNNGGTWQDNGWSDV